MNLPRYDIHAACRNEAGEYVSFIVPRWRGMLLPRAAETAVLADQVARADGLAIKFTIFPEVK